MYRIITFSIVIWIISLESCIKTNPPNGSTALNIVNAINNSNAIVTNFTPLNAKGIPVEPLQYYSSANAISQGNDYESGSYIGLTNLSIAQITDTGVTLWNGEFDLQRGSIHSLFFCGDTSSIDTLLTTDAIPYYPYSDSMAGVRFVNLAQGSLPMSVNLQGNPPTQTEFTNVGYKLMSTFKTYSANSSAPGSYNFEIRDQASDSLLAVFSWSYTLEKNNTIYIMGSQGAGFNAAQMNNF
jgi:hypothetical protein